MNTALPQVQEHYPAAHEHLKALPEHIAHEVGEAALRLAHRDMHPMQEKQDDKGKTWLEKDYGKRITDIDYDSSHLEADAIEAAHAGKEQLSTVLHDGSALLRHAHDDLRQQGAMFGEQTGETEEQKQERQVTERESVYDRALESAVDASLEAKRSGDTLGAKQAIEAVMLLQHVYGGMSKAGPIYRELVHGGSLEEVLSAAETAENISDGGNYSGMTEHMFPAKDLLRLASGKMIYKYSGVSEDLTENDFERMRLNGFDNIQNVLAAVSTPDTKLDVERAKQVLPKYELKDKLVHRLDQATDQSDLDQLYVASELSGVHNPTNSVAQTFESSIEYEKPAEYMQLAIDLGIPAYQIDMQLGENRRVEPGDLKHLNPDQVREMRALKEAIPDHFSVICDVLFKETGTGSGSNHEIAPISRSLRAINESGLEISPDMVSSLIRGSDGEAYTANLLDLAEEFSRSGINPSEVTSLLEKTKPKSISSLIGHAEKSGTDMEQLVADVRTEAEFADTYNDLYDQMRYPFNRNNYIRPTVEDAPLVLERMTSLGLDTEHCAGIFESWATFNAFQMHHYGETGFSDVKEAPSERTLDQIRNRQLDAMMTQLHAIEAFAGEYGAETLHQVVDRFGIYNFSRHDGQKLADQNTRWDSGGVIDTVIASARSDWNNFEGDITKFEEGQGDNVFDFEVNSAEELSRLAVSIGKRERQHGREPDVKRFIVHAHGNVTGILLGVNGEKLLTDNYRKAARERQKLPNAEINDYKKHLGQNYELILQACSVAGKTPNQISGARSMHEGHNVKVTAAEYDISSLTLKSDGTVEFSSVGEDSNVPPTVYQS